MNTQRLLALVGIGVSATAAVLLVMLVDLGAVAEAFRHADLVPLVVAYSLVAVSLPVRVVRWSILLNGDGGPPVATRRVFGPLVVGYLVNTLVPARLGEAARAYLVARRENREFPRAAGTVVLERILDVAVLALIGALAAAVVAPAPWIGQGLIVVAVVGVAAVVVLATLGAGTFQEWLESRRRPGRLSSTVVGMALQFVAGAGQQQRTRLAAAAILSAVAWLADGTIFWLIAQAMDLPLSWPAAMAVAAVTVLGTAVPSGPAYIGTYELAAVAVLVALGMPAEPALALAVLAHLAALPAAIAGAIVLLRMSLSMGSLIANARGSLEATN